MNLGENSYEIINRHIGTTKPVKNLNKFIKSKKLSETSLTGR